MANWVAADYPRACLSREADGLSSAVGNDASSPRDRRDHTQEQRQLIRTLNDGQPRDATPNQKVNYPAPGNLVARTLRPES